MSTIVSVATGPIARRVENALFKGQIPAVISGDHSMASGAIAGVAFYWCKNGKTSRFIRIDAYADLNLETTTASANLHGMPMAVLYSLEA